MDSKSPPPAANDELRPDEQVSKVGDLGRGSHEQTQGGADDAPKDLPGDQPAPAKRS